MSNLSLFMEMHDLLMPNSRTNPRPSSDQWERAARANFFLIMGMMLAKNTDLEEIKELLKDE